MSVVRVGATKQYSDNWDNIFSGRKGSPSSKKSAKKGATKSPKKAVKAAKKVAAKKSAGSKKRKSK